MGKKEKATLTEYLGAVPARKSRCLRLKKKTRRSAGLGKFNKEHKPLKTYNMLIGFQFRRAYMIFIISHYHPPPKPGSDIFGTWLLYLQRLYWASIFK